MKSFKEIARNALYIREKELHDKNCDGEGKILKFNAFTGARIDEDCPFCQRIIKFRLEKHLERTERYGEAETTNSNASNEDKEFDE